MSTPFSRKMQGVSARLLGKFGSSVSLIRVGAKTFNPVTGEYEWGAEQSIPLTAAPVPINAALIDGTAIQAGDMMVKADGAVVPAMEDKVEFGGDRWSVVGIEEKMVNDDVVAHFIQVRK